MLLNATFTSPSSARTSRQFALVQVRGRLGRVPLGQAASHGGAGPGRDRAAPAARRAGQVHQQAGRPGAGLALAAPAAVGVLLAIVQRR